MFRVIELVIMLIEESRSPFLIEEEERLFDLYGLEF